MWHHHYRRLSFIKIGFVRRVHPIHHHHIEGEEIMAFAQGPITLQVGQSAEAELLGFDQNGNPMPLPAGATVSYSIDAPSVATSTPNSDGQTDEVAAVSAGTANLTASVTGPNGVLSDTETVTVTVPQVLTSVKLAFQAN